MDKTTAVLASDMDGTFIPLDGNRENQQDLQVLSCELSRRGVELLYVTGRHFELAMEAVQAHGLPLPAWLICDVGTSLYHRVDGDPFCLDESYVQHLQDIVGSLSVQELSQQLAGMDGLSLQPAEKQGRFKLSYDCDAARLQERCDRVQERLVQLQAPYRIIASVDPFTGGGLIDLLPSNVSKAYALRWWVSAHERAADSVMFAGDSGNDLAALSVGYQSIVVGNAASSLVEQVTKAHAEAGWRKRLYVASKQATSGVLKGLRHFLGDGADVVS